MAMSAVKERMDADDLRPADEAILDTLADGRNNAPNIAAETGLTKQYIRERLGRLREDGIVETIGSGIYELQDDPRD